MNIKFIYKVFYILIISILLYPAISVSADIADEESGCRWQDGIYICESTGELSEGYYPFAGGGSCCNCNTKHYGILPDIFPEQHIEAVTFFLTTSRSSSLYSNIITGETAVKLTFTDPTTQIAYSSIATSIDAKASGIQLPIETKWYVTFEFEDDTVNVGPGWEWACMRASWLSM